ncbi:TPA: branched-chain amino acid transport system II carrier protein [Klebsiella pneumoniae]|nr:hypothetical protein [Klebsiella pneumoniae]VGQ14650.1 Branched-chain amino acid transport system 2 carrier protein [Klebsiella variicola]HBR1414380.1 branched-chain amino acid transport system II carrier protein [Klebsiella pneumoniae]HBR1478414.1 branched-chain amino acid transport system II carrier protein [Klebsiella pneumoniae]HBW7834823.1 hypothetical protein [Klebsiella pneumoniae]
MYGKGGSIFLGGLITLACLVTAIGLTCACATWFSDISPFSYRTLVFFFSGFSFLVSCAGLNHLIALSVPVLTAIYPAFIRH